MAEHTEIAIRIPISFVLWLTRYDTINLRQRQNYGWNRGEAHHGGSARSARYGNKSEASRRSQGAFGGGTRLTLWTSIERCWISMGAAGWHICFDVLDHLLCGTPIGRIAGPEAMKFGGWLRLNAEVVASGR